MTRRPPTPRARGAASAPAPPRRSAPRDARRGGSRATSRPGRTGATREPSRAGDLARLLSVRALLLGVVVLIGFAMVFPTVRAYLAQRAQLDSLAAEVAASEAREADLQSQLARWDTDAYVIAQARERLSYVMPGETAYRVIDPGSVAEESRVSSSSPDSDTGLALPTGGAVAPWYTTIWSSVQLAGEAPVPRGAGSASNGPGAAGDGSTDGPGSGDATSAPSP